MLWTLFFIHGTLKRNIQANAAMMTNRHWQWRKNFGLELCCVAHCCASNTIEVESRIDEHLVLSVFLYNLGPIKVEFKSTSICSASAFDWIGQISIPADASQVFFKIRTSKTRTDGSRARLSTFSSKTSLFGKRYEKASQNQHKVSTKIQIGGRMSGRRAKQKCL